MGWSREFIEKVREATDLTDVARDYGDVKNAGPGKVKMNCPLPNHTEKTPSHYVQKEFFKCFGCGEGGDIFKFVELLENCDFNDQVRRLADRAGIIPGPEDWIGGGGGEDRRKDVFAAMKLAADIYHQRLLNMENKEAQRARKYLRSRNITGQQAEKYCIGYSYPRTIGPSDGLLKELSEELASYFKESETSKDDVPQKVEQAMKRAGLTSNYEGVDTDFFFGERIMFTIFDTSDRPIAFSGRQLPNGRDPKYRNSPGSEIYKKDETLYGLNWARKHLAREDRIIICEGQLDVIAFHESTLPIAVAPCGTSMTENQVKKLARYTTNFLLCFDSDKAGQNAAKRFSQWEQKHKLQIKVVTLPEEKDPGDYHTENKLEELVKVIEDKDRTIPFLQWRIDILIKERATETIEERVKAAERCLQLVKDHPEEMYHDDYIRYTGEALDLPYSGLREKFDKMHKTPERKQFRETITEPEPDNQPATQRQQKPTVDELKKQPSNELALTVLSMVLHHRQILEQGNILPEKLSPILFPDQEFGAVFQALLTSSSLAHATKKIKESDKGTSIIAALRESKPDEQISIEIASKRVGELLVRKVEKEVDSLQRKAKKTNELELIRDIGDVHIAKNTLQNEGFLLFSPEADFLLSWLHEKLES